MLTDEVAQVHRSPGFITSNLIGKRSSDGAMIKEFEASHGTVADLWEAHLRGEETSMNPLGMVEAMIGALEHSAALASASEDAGKYSSPEEVKHLTRSLRKAMHDCFRLGEGTRDMAGPSGLTTEQFVDAVKVKLDEYLDPAPKPEAKEPCPSGVAPDPRFRRNYNVDKAAVSELFKEYDTNSDGAIELAEFEIMLVKLGVAPQLKPKEKHKEDETEMNPPV